MVISVSPARNSFSSALMKPRHKPEAWGGMPAVDIELKDLLYNYQYFLKFRDLRLIIRIKCRIKSFETPPAPIDKSGKSGPTNWEPTKQQKVLQGAPNKYPLCYITLYCKKYFIAS
jgi:hypothetical protein